MANLVKIAELLKNAPDQALMQELNNPGGGAPSYMVLSELQRRKKLRGSLMNNEPQSSVAEDLEAEASQANQMGLGSMGQQPQPMANPQQAPVGMAQGGEVPGYAEGDYVDDLPWEERMALWRQNFGFGSQLPPSQRRYAEDYAAGAVSTPQTAPQVAAAQVAPQAAPPAPPAAPPKTRAPAQAGIGSLGSQKSAGPSNYSVNPLLDELKGYRTQMADAYKQQAETYKQQAEDIKNAKTSDIGMALMQAGLGIAGGTSSNALQNVAQGAQPAMQAYMGMDRERRKELQKLAMGQGALGIEQLGAQMKGVTSEGELGLGGEKMAIARRSADADMLRANAAAAGVANQASQWKQDNAQERVNQQKANTLINYLKTDGINLDDATKAQYVAQINKLLGVGAAPQNKLSGNAKEGYKYGYN